MIHEQTVNIGPLRLECGTVLESVEQRVTIYGTPSADGSNVVLVEHALTGSGRVAEWWPGIVGEQSLFDPRRWCIVGINALGGCYGSTGPEATAPDGAPFGSRFPRVSVLDIVRAEMSALSALGVQRVDTVIGGSLGGMRALQWALTAPGRLRAAIIVGAHDHHSAQGIALNALQRDAIAIDPLAGLRLARKIAMLSYKSDELLRLRHERRADRFGKQCFDVEGYLEHQAGLFAARMDPASYVALTHAMDSFDVRDTRMLGNSPELIFVGITSDWLFLPQDVRSAARRFALRGVHAHYLQLRSSHGHDAFLADAKVLCELLEPYAGRVYCYD
jgi:homoserine O-acetyltransferase/O-succinyltransferase